MDGDALQDKFARGMGLAARKLGTPYIVYRPTGNSNPICSRARIIKLYASFAASANLRSAASFGQAAWIGVFDASYTQPGDYLVGAAGTFFIAGQRPGLAIQCVLSNRVAALARPQKPVTGGYSGAYAGSSTLILSGWPCSLLEAGGHGSDGGVAKRHFGDWIILLPATPQSPQVGDIVTDDLGLTYAVGAAEQTGLGWRLAVRQICA